MAAMNDYSPFNTRLLFSLKKLGIDKFIHRSRVTMESEKYICVRETKSVVIIDMTKPTQPIRLPITADSAIMNPDTLILAFKVEAKIDGTTSQDQLRIYDVNTQTTLKSYNIAEKVECWKWISPKLLVLVTRKAVYHWSLEDSEEPVKMCHMPDELATHKDTIIRNYMLHDPTKKWLAIGGYQWENHKQYYSIFVRRYEGGDQWFSLYAHAAAFTTFNVEGTNTPSTLLCSAYTRLRADNTRYIELRVSDRLGSQQGKPNFRKKHGEFNNITDSISYVQAVQISQKYGLIYVITEHALVFIHDLEKAEAICSCKIADYKTYEDDIICTTEGPSSESFYAINQKGQVLLTGVNDSTMFSLVSDKLLSRGKARELRKLCLQLLEEKEEIVKNLEKSRQEEKTKIMRETDEQLASMRTNLNNFLNVTLNEIEDLKKENSKLQDETDKIAKHMEESLHLETKLRREIEEQLANKMIELNDYQKLQEQMMNKIEGLKMQIIELTKEREIVKNPEEFHFLIESNYLVENFIDFTEAELRKATNDFNDSHKIEDGEYGSVYKAFLGLKPVAVKILRLESQNGGSKFNQEVSISSRLRHPNLVMFLGACTEKQALVYELMPNGSLHDILRNKKQSIILTWKTRIHIASNICSGLICLHSAKPHGIVHGNLKSTNILLDSNYTAKLSDFGTCGHLQQYDTVIMPHPFTIYPKGALPYIDPEYFSTNELTSHSDVYSFGIVLLELVSGRDPMGLRKSVKDALRKGENFVDTSAGEWPFEEAKRMVLLGLQCSDPSGENRPDLVNEVLVDIESMRLASLRF